MFLIKLLNSLLRFFASFKTKIFSVVNDLLKMFRILDLLTKVLPSSIGSNGTWFAAIFQRGIRGVFRTQWYNYDVAFFTNIFNGF